MVYKSLVHNGNGTRRRKVPPIAFGLVRMTRLSFAVAVQKDLVAAERLKNL